MITCQTCGDTRQDNFCPNCGEKKFNPHALSIKHFAEETFEGFWHFDTKFFRSVLTLLTRPAELSVQYRKGITVRFMKPLSLFLVANLIFFILPLHNLFSLPMYNYLNFEPFKTAGKTIESVRNKLKESNQTEKELTTSFNTRIRSTSKVFIILFIPFFAIIFAMFFFRSGERFGGHLVFAIHFMTFLVVLFLIQSIVFSILPISYSTGVGDAMVSAIDGLILSVYLTFAIRRFYATPWWQAILSSLVIIFIFMYAVQAYRIFLFHQVLRSM
jgi:hypothetical protein